MSEKHRLPYVQVTFDLNNPKQKELYEDISNYDRQKFRSMGKYVMEKLLEYEEIRKLYTVKREIIPITAEQVQVKAENNYPAGNGSFSKNPMPEVAISQSSEKLEDTDLDTINEELLNYM